GLPAVRPGVRGAERILAGRSDRQAADPRPAGRLRPGHRPSASRRRRPVLVPQVAAVLPARRQPGLRRAVLSVDRTQQLAGRRPRVTRTEIAMTFWNRHVFVLLTPDAILRGIQRE